MALSLVASVSLQADPVSGSSTFTTFPFEPPSTLRPGTKLLLCFRHHPSRDLGYFNPWNLSPSAKKGSSQGPRGSLERSPCAVPWFDLGCQCRRSCLLSLTESPLTMNLNSRGLSVWLEYVFRCFMQTTVFKIITLFTAKKFNISRCIITIQSDTTFITKKMQSYVKRGCAVHHVRLEYTCVLHSVSSLSEKQ
jgi:hypothetical protein